MFFKYNSIRQTPMGLLFYEVKGWGGGLGCPVNKHQCPSYNPPPFKIVIDISFIMKTITEVMGLIF